MNLHSICLVGLIDKLSRLIFSTSLFMQYRNSYLNCVFPRSKTEPKDSSFECLLSTNLVGDGCKF